MNKVAIVLQYEGYEPSEEIIKNVVANLSACTVGSNHVNVKVFNDADIARMLVERSVIANNTIIKTGKLSGALLIETSLKNIHERFSRDLTGDDKSALMFAVNLSSALTRAHLYGEDSTLINDIKILKDNRDVYIKQLKPALRSKYGITPSIYDTIINIYDNVVTE